MCEKPLSTCADGHDSDIHFPSGCQHTRLTAYTETHTHPPSPWWRARGVGAWKWLAIWTSSRLPTACQLVCLQFHCCGCPRSLACCLISDPHTSPWRPALNITNPPPTLHTEPTNKQFLQCSSLVFVQNANKTEKDRNNNTDSISFKAKGRTAACATHFSLTTLLPHLLLLLLLLQHMRARWITVQSVGCSSWYASPLYNKLKPTCDQPLDNATMQTVYIWEDLPFLSIPEPKPLAVRSALFWWGGCATQGWLLTPR